MMKYVYIISPIVDLPTGKVLDCRALCRWNSPEKGFVPPAEFIPVAETFFAVWLMKLGYFVLKNPYMNLQYTSRGLDSRINLSYI